MKVYQICSNSVYSNWPNVTARWLAVVYSHSDKEPLLTKQVAWWETRMLQAMNSQSFIQMTIQKSYVPGTILYFFQRQPWLWQPTIKPINIYSLQKQPCAIQWHDSEEIIPDGGYAIVCFCDCYHTMTDFINLATSLSKTSFALCLR
jgi:hypothetical protein